jgi:hypothetical protein
MPQMTGPRSIPPLRSGGKRRLEAPDLAAYGEGVLECDDGIDGATGHGATALFFGLLRIFKARSAVLTCRPVIFHEANSAGTPLNTW